MAIESDAVVLGKNIKRIRKSQKRTQEDLAFEAEISVKMLGKLRDKEKEYLKEKEVIGADILGDCPWCTALIIAGENCIESNMRHPKSKGTTSDYDIADLDISPATHWVGASHFDTPEAAYLKKEAAMEVRKGMKQLTPKQREAIQLCYYEGYTQEEAAQKLGLAQSTISGRIEYGEKALSDGLKKYFKNF